MTGNTFQQHLVADIFQLIRLSTGHESQSADYRGGVASESTEMEKTPLFLDTLAAVVFPIHAQRHQRRDGVAFEICITVFANAGIRVFWRPLCRLRICHKKDC